MAIFSIITLDPSTLKPDHLSIYRLLWRAYSRRAVVVSGSIPDVAHAGRMRRHKKAPTTEITGS